MWSTWTTRPHGTFTLPRDTTLRLGDGVLRVERGTVLVTRSGDPEDHVLVARAELRLAPGARAVAWALEDAVVTVACPEAATAPEQARPSPLARTA